VRTIATIVTCWSRSGSTGRLEVDKAPYGLMIMLGAGTTLAVVVHAALQMYGTYKCGLFVLPSRGWKDDPESRTPSAV